MDLFHEQGKLGQATEPPLDGHSSQCPVAGHCGRYRFMRLDVSYHVACPLGIDSAEGRLNPLAKCYFVAEDGELRSLQAPFRKSSENTKLFLMT